MENQLATQIPHLPLYGRHGGLPRMLRKSNTCGLLNLLSGDILSLQISDQDRFWYKSNTLWTQDGIVILKEYEPMSLAMRV